MRHATNSDPQKKALKSASTNHWSFRPDPDVRHLMQSVIGEFGRNKQFWIHECLRAGLAKYAGKKVSPPQLVVPTTIKG